MSWMTGINFLEGAVVFFFLCHCVQISSTAYPFSYPVRTRGFFPGIKKPGHEADHSPPSSDKVKNVWSHTSISQYIFMAKHRDNFTIIKRFCDSGLKDIPSLQWFTLSQDPYLYLAQK